MQRRSYPMADTMGATHTAKQPRANTLQTKTYPMLDLPHGRCHGSHNISVLPCSSMGGWTCEEWMDWAETRAPFALYQVKWPAPTGKVNIQEVFTTMWRYLRCLVMHYMRPTKYSGYPEFIERARKWGQKYACLAEQVCAPLSMTQPGCTHTAFEPLPK